MSGVDGKLRREIVTLVATPWSRERRVALTYALMAGTRTWFLIQTEYLS